MNYMIITETGNIYSVERTFLNTRLSVTFKDISEDNKEIELNNAAYFRFLSYYTIEDNVATNFYNTDQYLKLVPQSDNNSFNDIPSLSLMA